MTEAVLRATIVKNADGTHLAVIDLVRPPSMTIFQTEQLARAWVEENAQAIGVPVEWVEKP